MQAGRSVSRAAAVCLLLSFVSSSDNETCQLSGQPNESGCCASALSGRFDCLPDKTPQERTRDVCQARGCCWQNPVAGEEAGRCDRAPSAGGYSVRSVRPFPGGMEAVLVRNPEAPPSGFPGDVSQLKLSVQFLGGDVLRIKISDSEGFHFESPTPVLNLDALQNNTEDSRDPAYDVRIVSDPASFQVIRKSTGVRLFDTGVSDLIFSRQYLEVSTQLSSGNLWGLGEHYATFNKGSKNGTYTLFNRGDLVPPEESGMNLYGSHPLYLAMEKSGDAHGVFLLNSNAMDVVVQQGSNANSLTYRTIGGVLDFFFFLGPSPDAVVRQYTSLVGRPFMPPYWTLGFHLSRYGFNTTQETKETWTRNRQAGIPLDTMWSDIDYMDHMKDFTFDPVRMRGINQFIEELHSDGVHYIMNNSPGMTGEEPEGSYPPVDEAKALDILIRDYKGDLLEATVWQNITYLLDFSNPKIVAYWEKNFRSFHEQVNFDAAWIDMNEPYSFLPGSHTGCPADNTLDHPPYVPGGGLIYNGTICLSAQQHLSTHYNLHNLFATMETIATNKAIAAILEKRPFILSRASSPGHGVWGTHWSGDIHSSWNHLQYSIPNMLEFNMFGIPMVGSDICGFVGSTQEELCIRWMQLGSFYPFSRNHNDFDTIPQDPASFSVATQGIMRNALLTRYQLLPHLYTLLYHSHRDGSPVIRPLFYDFPSEEETFGNDRQFLWGELMMVVPVLDLGARDVTAYIPNSVWYDFYTGVRVIGKGYMILDAPLVHINLLIKEGGVIPMQEPNVTTTISRTNPFQVLVTLDGEGNARGDLYWDDGDSIDSVTGEKYNLVQFEVGKNTLRNHVTQLGYKTPMLLSQVKVYGVSNVITNVQFSNPNLVNAQTLGFQYDGDKQVLEIQLEKASLLDENVITWS